MPLQRAAPGGQTPLRRLKECSLEGSTIIGAPFEAHSPQLRSLLAEQLQPTFTDEDEGEGRRLFKIRTANSSGERSSASILIKRMYATRGYNAPALPAFQQSNLVTLMATEGDMTIGTLSVGFDSPYGLLADDLFRDEIDELRLCGRRVCEFTKLAMDQVVKSKRVLAYLFHTAYIWAHRLRGYHDLLIEVNPRHVRYYEKMLGFTVMGPERLNRRVNAPAVLLRLDLDHAHEQIQQFGGKPQLAANERSLYPYFFSIQQEAGIVGRMRWTQAETAERAAA